MMSKIITIHACDNVEFDRRVNDALENGFKLSSSSSATLGPEYDYGISLVAIMVKE